MKKKNSRLAFMVQHKVIHSKMWSLNVLSRFKCVSLLLCIKPFARACAPLALILFPKHAKKNGTSAVSSIYFIPFLSDSVSKTVPLRLNSRRVELCSKDSPKACAPSSPISFTAQKNSKKALKISISCQLSCNVKGNLYYIISTYQLLFISCVN